MSSADCSESTCVPENALIDKSLQYKSIAHCYGHYSRKSAPGADPEKTAKYMRGGRKITKSLGSSLPIPTGNDSMVEKMGGEMPKCWTQQPGSACGFAPLDSVLKQLLLGIPRYNFSASLIYFSS